MAQTGTHTTEALIKPFVAILFTHIHLHCWRKRQVFAFLRGIFLDNPFPNPVLTQAYSAAPDYSSGQSLGLRAL